MTNKLDDAIEGKNITIEVKNNIIQHKPPINKKILTPNLHCFPFVLLYIYVNFIIAHNITTFPVCFSAVARPPLQKLNLKKNTKPKGPKP